MHFKKKFADRLKIPIFAAPNMVSVVQLVEHRIVVPSVVGSSPITHPNEKRFGKRRTFFIFRKKTTQFVGTVTGG